MALVLKLGIVSPDDLGGVCVYRCQIKKLCDDGLLMRVGYGRYQIGPVACAGAPVRTPDRSVDPTPVTELGRP